MHTFLSLFAHAMLPALVLAAVGAVFKAPRPARVATPTEVAAPAAKPAPAEPSAETPRRGPRRPGQGPQPRPVRRLAWR